eukprot:6492322-Amphidinium_carterae.3
MSWATGSIDMIVLVQYDIAGPVLWHQRLVLAEVRTRRGHYFVLTPTGDLFEEQLSSMNPDLAGIRAAREDGGDPEGLVGRVFRFNPRPPEARLSALKEEGKRLALAEEAADRAAGGGAVAVGAVAMAAAAVPAVRVARGPALGGDAADGEESTWRSLQAVGGILYGDPVPAPEVGKRVGNEVLRGVVDVEGTPVCCEFVHSHQLQSFMDRSVAVDARVLPVRRKGGKRHRSIASICSDMKQETFGDWPLQGTNVRTTAGCLNYLSREEESLDRHHERVRSVAKLDLSSWGMTEHNHLSEIVAQFLHYDQLDPCNSAGLESAFRRLQAIEFGWLEKVRDLEAKSAGTTRLTGEEFAIMSGSSRMSSSLMVAPALLEHTRAELEREASVVKNMTKLREGRKSLREKP